MTFCMRVKVDYQSATNIKKMRLPGLLTDRGILVSLLQYHSEQRRSMSWRDRVNLAVILLLDFIAKSGIPFDSPTTLLMSFSNALRNGTIDLDLEDPTGLFWSARTANDADELIGYLTGYTDWLATQPGHSGVLMNPIRRATTYEEKLNWCAYHHRQDAKLLNHLTKGSEAEKNQYARQIQRERSLSIMRDEVKRFPKDSFNKLIDNGFIIASALSKDERRYTDYKSQAMTLLMHWGGVRKSELFHIYLDDIDIDLGRMEVVIRIHHPSEGTAPEKGYKNREDYLLRKFRLKPRVQYLKSETQHAGWKAPTVNSHKFFNVNFYPPAKATEFLLAFRNYLLYQRAEPSGLGHPYAFTNSKGRPETIKNFQRLHKSAVKRIGLQCGKYYGTTEHGHRHAYGYRLAEAGFTQIEIQKSMHHKSPNSCLIYVQMTNADLNKRMREVEKRANAESLSHLVPTSDPKSDSYSYPNIASQLRFQKHDTASDA